MSDTRRSGGNFRERAFSGFELLSPRDFNNPWNFYGLLLNSEDSAYEWCRCNGLLAMYIPCNVRGCSGEMTLKEMSSAPGGKIFRCSVVRDHRRPCRTNSFFEKINLPIQDVILFVKNYLDGLSLHKCANFSGMAYKSTAVNWASYIRELFKEYFERTIKNQKLSGVIEIDESLFGRRVKHHRGNPNAGLKIWIFGLVERESGKMILYPVSDRTEDTLVPIIRRHVEEGSTIYSDGWSAYCSLNEMGYDHFTVIHKYSFKKVYVNIDTKEVVSVHTNRIEGSWKHAKDHFRRMAGTKLGQFEGHLAEIMWRCDARDDLYFKFFELLRSIYPLDTQPVYKYTTPLFDTWRPGSSSDDPPVTWEIMPANTDAESCSDSEVAVPAGGSQKPVLISSESEPNSYPTPFPPNKPLPFKPQGTHGNSSLEKSLLDMMSTTSISDEDPDETLIHIPNTPIVSTRKPGPSHQSSGKLKLRHPRRPERVCHPPGFKEKNVVSESDVTDNPEPQIPTSSSRRRKPRKHVGKGKGKPGNPYAKSAFLWSDDDDFQ